MISPCQAALTVDVEDWESATALQCFGELRPPTPAVEYSTLRLLELFEAHGVKATWFFLGEVAETYPRLVADVVRAGHEPGVHGYHHHRLETLHPDAFRAYLRLAKSAVEAAGGQAVRGYRAVDFGISPSTLWALEILAGEGFHYDASLYPFQGPRYGFPRGPLTPFALELGNGRRLAEFPNSVAVLLGRRFPCGGGGYLRRLPFPLFRSLFATVRRQGQLPILYLHPCEVDPEQPLTFLGGLVPPERRSWFRRYLGSQKKNRDLTIRRLKTLFRSWTFGPLSLFLDKGHLPVMNLSDLATGAPPQTRESLEEPGGARR